MTNNYGNNSIRKKTDLEAVRTRVYNYAGGSDKRGAFHTVHEILSNGIDEYKAGYGKEIHVKYKNKEITVQDNGRGVPMDWNEVEEEYNYTLIYETLNAGGKGSSDEKEGSGYDYAIGLNGIGSALSILSSSKAKVISVRDGYEYEMQWEKGVPNIDLIKNRTDKSTGTTVIWTPDDVEVFDENNFPKAWFEDYLKEQSIVNKNLKIIFEFEDDEPQEFYYENGIIDYVNEINLKPLTETVYFQSDDVVGKDYDNKQEYKSKYEFAFGFGNVSPTIQSFHNSSYLKHGGAPHDAIKSAFVHVFNLKLKEFDLYKKKDSKVSFDDIVDSLVIVTNTYSTETSYQNQTKFAITNKFIKDKLNELLRTSLTIWFLENEAIGKKICQQVLANKYAREKAEKTRIDTKKVLSAKIGSIDSKNRIDGFYNCADKKEKDKHILAICEGKSALSSLKVGRTKYHAILPIRGKILNCFKANESDIMKNQVILSIYKVLGCGVDLGKKGSSKNTFDIDKLNFPTIEIYVDADEDGVGSILPLLLTMFWKLSPDLIREGRVKLGITPKYMIRTLDKVLFAMTDDDLEKIKTDLKNTKYEIGYVKGLAELTPEAIAMSMSVENNQSIEIRVDEEQKSIELLDLFMGEKVEPRKKYILSTFEDEVVV